MNVESGRTFTYHGYLTGYGGGIYLADLEIKIESVKQNSGRHEREER